MIPTELDNIDARLTKPVLDDIEAIRKRGTGLISVRADQVLEFIERGIDSMKEIDRLRSELSTLRDDYERQRIELANESLAVYQCEQDIIQQRAAFDKLLTASVTEMRERAARMTEGWVGHIPNDIGSTIRRLPLEPEGEKT